MPNAYKPALIQIRPQYTETAAEEPEASGPENILWFVGATPGSFPLTLGNLATISAAFDPAWANMWKVIGSNAYYFTGSVVTDWSADTGYDASSVGVFTPVAGVTGTPNSAQVAMLLSYVSGTLPRYRGGHPRTYLPFTSSSHLNTAWLWTTAITESVSSEWATAMGAMAGIASSAGGGYIPNIFRFRDNPSTAALYPIDEVTVQGIPSTQRRRVRRITRK